MKASNGSNVASPQALAITALATRYLLDNEFSVEPQLGEAVDALLVEEDEETLQTISLLLYEKDTEASEDFWDYARERAEMFLTEEGQVSTLFAVPVRHPESIQGFSAERAAASFFTHGLVCANAKVTFYPAPVDGGQLLNMSPVEVFRLHTALGQDYREAATLLSTQAYAEGTHPYICFIGIVSYSAQMPGHCVAWELPSDDFVRRIQTGRNNIPWKQLDQARADVIERIFDLLRESGVMGLMFQDYEAAEISRVQH